MTKLQQLFATKKSNILNVYCTAGFPKLESTIEVINALQANGADIIEIGMPYSDPLADGPIIQESSSIALANGMTIEKLFQQLLTIKASVPIVLMGYMNPVLQFGFEKFCLTAAACGVSGLIIPDLPMHEFETEYCAIIKKHGLDFIFLVTPETSNERVKKLDSLSTGFLYAVSSSSTTGSNNATTNLTEYLTKLKNLNLQNPLLVGFGIKDKASFNAACAHANGAIIGTAYIKALFENDHVEETTKQFLKAILP